MGVSRSKEPDLRRAEAVARDGCILRAVVGSNVHGLAHAGTDDRDDVGQRTALGVALQALAPAFVSRRTGRAFLGYVDSQRRGLMADGAPPRARELSRHHGYDTKYAMHALRIAHQGIELLTTGRISLPVGEPERTSLMAVRRGEIPLSEVLDRLRDRSAALERLVFDDAIAPDCDRAAVDRFLVTAYEQAWAGR